MINLEFPEKNFPKKEKDGKGGITDQLFFQFREQYEKDFNNGISDQADRTFANSKLKWCDANRALLELVEERAPSQVFIDKIKSSAVSYLPQLVNDKPLQDLFKICLAEKALSVEIGGKEYTDPKDIQFAAPHINDARVLIKPDAVAKVRIKEIDRNNDKFDYELVGGKECLYQLLLQLSFRWRGAAIADPLACNREPWSVKFTKISPILAQYPAPSDSVFYGWRGDNRKPSTIFQTGFLPKLTSRATIPGFESLWSALSTAYLSVKDAASKGLSSGGATPTSLTTVDHIWFRYGQEDLCLSSSIAIATCFSSSVVFPLHSASSGFIWLADNNGPLNNPVKAPRVTPSKVDTVKPEVSYVYALKKRARDIHDTGHIVQIVNKEFAWAEVAASSVEKDEILFALEVSRWPVNPGLESQSAGFFSISGLYIRNPDGTEGARKAIDTDENVRVELWNKFPPFQQCLKWYLPPVTDQKNYYYEWVSNGGFVFEKRGSAKVRMDCRAFDKSKGHANPTTTSSPASLLPPSSTNTKQPQQHSSPPSGTTATTPATSQQPPPTPSAPSSPVPKKHGPPPARPIPPAPSSSVPKHGPPPARPIPPTPSSPVPKHGPPPARPIPPAPSPTPTSSSPPTGF